MNGLTAVRTGRLLASLMALVGMVFMFIERALSAILVMAADAVKLGLARYNNFTGRFAAQNFSEDKQLLTLLKDVQAILPPAETALTVFMVVSILFLVVAILGLAFPKQFVHILVALKLLKWAEPSDTEEETAGSLKETLEKLGNIPLKKFALPCAVVLGSVLAVFAVRSCHETVQESNFADAIDEMTEQSLNYINAQKEYFAKNNLVGNAKALQLYDSSSTDVFEYRITPSRFTAVSKVQIATCPAGSKWSVSASAKGLFTKELALFRSAPKDTNCVKLTPEYRNLGKVKKQAPKAQ